MATIDRMLDGTASIQESARSFIEDPLTFFDLSLTKMQSVPRDRLAELQTQALSLRFEQQKDRIPTAPPLSPSASLRSSPPSTWRLRQARGDRVFAGATASRAGTCARSTVWTRRPAPAAEFGAYLDDARCR